MGALSPAHWAVIAIVLFVLFGARRLPDMARGVGQSLRILRSEVRELEAEAAADQPRPDPSGVPDPQRAG
ncbi:Sec-independent protein translocase subunit TatA [Gordonia sp. VNK21]|uniref:Sec-independent protein translocase subunit TatA n=1 Tax=Gordonia sp. VNK21 TaxID=3382483 RepID=UPI0038D45F65